MENKTCGFLTEMHLQSSKLHYIEILDKLEIHENDLLVYKAASFLNQQQFDQIGEFFQNLLRPMGIDNPLLILQAGEDIGILRRTGVTGAELADEYVCVGVDEED